MPSSVARALVFVTSALVLVLEIVAGRLVAPYVGVSLETFTAIIGTVLAGIAAGSWAGGWIADNLNPAKLLGPAIILGGVLTWLSVPIVRGLGPGVTASPGNTVFLVTAAFLAPAGVVSTVSPLVAKLTLESVDETGRVVAGLSAAGTFGALAGTFFTGFVLLSILPGRTIVFLIGVALVLIGLAVSVFYGKNDWSWGATASVLVFAALPWLTSSVCQHETEYFCVSVVPDEDRAGGRSLRLDLLRHGHVDLDDPGFLDIRYVRLLDNVVEALPAGQIDALHIGGGAFSLPRHILHERPDSTHVVLEIDDQLVEIAEEQLDLVQSDQLEVRVGDGRQAMRELSADSFDVIIGDAFGSESVPWHLTTLEVVDELVRLLRPDGVYAMNVIDDASADFVRAQVATLGERFDHIAVIQPGTDPTGYRFNVIFVASNAPLPTITVSAEDGVLIDGDPWGDGQILTDDFAPVDQLQG